MIPLQEYFEYVTKAAFELTSNWFRKWFSEKWGAWLLLQIRSNWKTFPVDRKWEPKQRKIIFVSIFTSNDFRPWKIEERERGRKKEEIATSPALRRPLTSSASWTARCRHHQHRECVDRDRRIARTSRSRLREASIAPIVISSFAISPSFVRIWWFFLGFVCVLRNEWYYIFVW